MTKEGAQGSASIQIIIAALNEEEGIGPTIAELKEYVDKAKILVVDGKSVDKTTEVAKTLGAEIVIQDGRGKGEYAPARLRYVNIILTTGCLTAALATLQVVFNNFGQIQLALHP